MSVCKHERGIETSWPNVSQPLATVVVLQYSFVCAQTDRQRCVVAIDVVCCIDTVDGGVAVFAVVVVVVVLLTIVRKVATLSVVTAGVGAVTCATYVLEYDESNLRARSNECLLGSILHTLQPPPKARDEVCTCVLPTFWINRQRSGEVPSGGFAMLVATATFAFRAFKHGREMPALRGCCRGRYVRSTCVRTCVRAYVRMFVVAVALCIPATPVNVMDGPR